MLAMAGFTFIVAHNIRLVFEGRDQEQWFSDGLTLISSSNPCMSRAQQVAREIRGDYSIEDDTSSCAPEEDVGLIKRL